jgi:hypothetical protein
LDAWAVCDAWASLSPLVWATLEQAARLKMNKMNKLIQNKNRFICFLYQSGNSRRKSEDNTKSLDLPGRIQKRRPCVRPSEYFTLFD